MPIDDEPVFDALQTQIEFLSSKRETIFAELQETFDMSKSVAPGNVSAFLARCSELTRLKDKFELVQEKIMEINLQLVSAKRMEVSQVTKAFNDLFYKIRKIEFELGTHACTPRVASAPDSDNYSCNDIRLPKLEVPVWDGEMENFHNFWNLFNTIVHKAKYANVVKMAYLQRSLTGSPLKLIQHLDSESYADAYQLIYDRYGNTRNLAAFYADKILSFPPLTSSSTKDLQSFLDVFHTTVTAFNNLAMDDHHDFIMFQCAFRALPLQTRTLFERSLRNRENLPSFENLINFVINQCQIEELTRRTPSSLPKASPPPQKPLFKPRRNLQSLIVTPDSLPSSEQKANPRLPSTSSTPCVFCSALSHRIYHCPKYKELTLDAKYDWLKTNKRCFRCLGSHNRSKCTSLGKCESCHSPAHHSSLHRTTNPPSQQIRSSSSEEHSPVGIPISKVQTNVAVSVPGIHPAVFSSVHPSTPVSSSSVVSNSTFVCDSRTVLLGTAQALILNKWGKWEPIRLVVDGASQINLISSQCTQRLGLPAFHRETHIDGALSQSVGTSKGVVSCSLAPRDSPTEVMSTEAVIVKKVCSDLPTTSVPIEIFQRFSHLSLADRTFCERGEIDFLLGASLYTQLFKNNYGVIHGEPSAMQTIFGWIIIGTVNTTPLFKPSPVSMITTLNNVDLDRTLQAFWQTEEVSPRIPIDPMHQIAEDHFVSTHARRPDGSYEVRLPFVPGVQPKFVDSEAIALKRWLNQEKKLQKDPLLRASYHQFLTEYQQLQHMSVAKEKGEYYIPHFGILRDSPTSPLRVVFDAGCTDAEGKNLNSFLLAGKPLQKDIRHIVTLFRLKPVALITDIKMMYRFIWVHPDDTKFQHILWRNSVESPILDMELKTLVYGQTSSPFLAQRVLLALVNDEGSRYPLASQAILEACFMDDLCTSVDSEAEAHQLKDELIQLMKLGGFELRKWASNSQSVLDSIPLEHQLPSLSLHSDTPTSLHVLGLQWEPQADHFTYKVSCLDNANSKREVCSRIASLFDPLGWVSPVVLTAKLFLRELWKRALDWDTPLPPDLQVRWLEYSSQFLYLAKIKIPRLLVEPKLQYVQLVGFCDASSVGYAAVLYLRSCSEDERAVSVTMVSSKSKVAPLKPITIPRLELNAALLMAKMVSSFQPLIQKLNIVELKLFSDSTVVLGWLRTPPHLLQTYVANRVVSVLEVTQLTQWHHISTNINIADVASRGALPTTLVDHPSWWAGPAFLYQPVANWPLDKSPLPRELPEMKVKNTAMPVVQRKSKPKPKPLVIACIERFSSLNRLKRVMAWVLRFIRNCKHGKGSTKRRQGVLQPSELQDSMVVLVKASQRHHFAAELRDIARGKPLPLPLRRLSPFLEKGVLRVGGRLSNSLLSDEAKHPPLLPKDARLSTLICTAYHRRLMHAGPQATQAAICQEFWILCLRNLLRHTIFKCSVCHRFTIKESHPKMADLPSSRVTPCAPFSRTAVDYAGPVLIKQSIRRNAPTIKAWIAVFVCMVTKGVHLELVSSLSTECFMAALNRFIGRRGLCKDIYCDNGTNFHGAHSDEKEIYEFLRGSHPEIAGSLANRHIMYHFNPPDAPWMGGIFEAAVKSAKRHMRHITTRSLTYEELNTVLVRVEAVLNSRPLCPIGDAPDSFYLSPAHFLIGRSLLTPIERDMDEGSHLSRWQSVQQAAQTFWKKWSSDYLHTLMERKKWTESLPPLKEGQVVIVLRQHTKPLDWPLGRVLKLHCGSDGIARSATVRTATGVYVRPIARLSPLPTHDNEA